ncbi:MAG TPA: hypothetical protein DIS79_07005 [Bacteroidetes bacterium]|nr:hypothetical protein [Bacteroidota bacterium]HRK05043.1 hypothetical protein [Chlorobiota bacterium]
MRFSLLCNRFTLFGFVAAIVLTLPSHGTEDPTYRVLGGIGYRSAAPTIITSPVPNILDTTSYVSAFVPSINLGLGIRYPLTMFLALRSDVSYTTTRGNVQSRRDIIVAVDGRPVQGTLRQDAAVTADVLQLDIGLCFGLHRLFKIDAVIGLAFPMTPASSVNHVLESPPGVTFVDGGGSTRMVTNANMTPLQTMATAGVDLRSQLRVTNDISIEPTIGTRIAVTPADAYGWRPFTLSFGIAIAYTSAARPEPLQEPLREPIQESRQDLSETRTNDSLRIAAQQTTKRKQFVVSRSDIDTITIVDAWSRDRRDTVYTRRSHQHSDTVRGTDTDTIVLREHITIEEHLPGAPPFLSSVLRVDLPATVIDTAADVMVHVNVVSDTQSTTLVEVWHNDSVVHQRTLSLGSGVVMFRLTDVLADITRRDNVTLRVTARTTDAVGQTINAAPRIITLRRSGGRRLRTR